MIFELKQNDEFVPKTWPRGNSQKPSSEQVRLEFDFPTGPQIDSYTKVIVNSTTKQARQVADGADPESTMSWETIQHNDRIFRDCVRVIHGITVREDGQDRAISTPGTLLALPDSIGYHHMVVEFGNFILNASRLGDDEAKNS